jgi:hypothetical protein
MNNLKQTIKKMNDNKLETLVKFLRFYRKVADYPFNILVQGVSKIKNY